MVTTPEKAEAFRSLGIVTFLVGARRELTFSESSRAAQILPSDDVDLLTACVRFKPIASHAETICSESGLPPDYAPAIRDLLSKMAADGLLVSQRRILEHCRPGPALPPISTLGVITRNRPEALLRCLDSYMTNARTHGRSIDFTVTDDSRAPEMVEKNRQALVSLRARYGVNISYAGPDEKKRFAEALKREGAADPEILDFALFDPEAVGHTAGANRNALLLATLGKMFVSVDDDTECFVAPVPDSRPDSLAFSSRSDPTETWHFDSRESALRASPFSERDFISLHEDLLGRDLGDCAARSTRTNLDRMDARFLRALMEGYGRVRISQIGLIGDCAMGSSLWILGNEGQTKERMLRSEPDYRTAASSREVIRGVTVSTVSNDRFFMTYGAGFDHRSLLPPFMPVNRFQDGIFAATLQKVLRFGGIAHLPWAVLHAPLGSREFSPQDVWREAGLVFSHDYIMHALDSFEISPAKPEGKERLRALGRHLVDLGSMEATEFDDFLRRTVWMEAGAWIHRMEQDLERHQAMAPYWAEDVRKMLDQQRHMLSQPDLLVPGDLSQGRTSEEACALSQRLVLRFGRLLETWSEIVESARAMQNRGIHLASPV